MRLLVVGGGGREHALCWALRHENPDADLYCAPGNPGTADLATNLPIAADDLDRIADAADMHGIDLTVVGPEVPLARGLADRLRAEGRAVFGPSAAAAQLEASKAFSKEVMQAAGIPTARSRTFTELHPALDYVDRHAEPLVVKASGLAAGKGAVVCLTRAEAAAAVRSMLGDRAFGEAGATVVIESFLEGEEISVLAVTDGRDVELLPVSQDHKRLLEGDAGPNTGGMGAYSPVPIAGPEMVEQVMATAVQPTLDALLADGISYRGVLYAGIMLTADGPKVLEYNVRFGDPECQVVVPRMASDLGELCRASAAGDPLPPVEFADDACVTVVLASEHYPEAPRTGDVIDGLDDVAALPDVCVFHAGTARRADGAIVTAGGRVLAVSGSGPTIADARQRAYDAVGRITWPGMQHRTDIAHSASGARR